MHCHAVWMLRTSDNCNGNASLMKKGPAFKLFPPSPCRQMCGRKGFHCISSQGQQGQQHRQSCPLWHRCIRAITTRPAFQTCCRCVFSSICVAAGACLVFLLKSHDAGQVGHLALHAVDALHHNQDLLPWPIYSRLTLCYRLPEHQLQMFHIIVCKHLDMQALLTRIVSRLLHHLLHVLYTSSATIRIGTFMGAVVAPKPLLLPPHHRLPDAPHHH